MLKNMGSATTLNFNHNLRYTMGNILRKYLDINFDPDDLIKLFRVLRSFTSEKDKIEAYIIQLYAESLLTDLKEIEYILDNKDTPTYFDVCLNIDVRYEANTVTLSDLIIPGEELPDIVPDTEIIPNIIEETSVDVNLDDCNRKRVSGDFDWCETHQSAFRYAGAHCAHKWLTRS